MDFGYLAGWVALGFGVLVAPAQLIKILRTGRTDGISLWTYIFLCLALMGYLIHAIYISAPVFIVSNFLGLTINSIILTMLWRRRRLNGYSNKR